jgi:hypothetical protein
VTVTHDGEMLDDNPMDPPPAMSPRQQPQQAQAQQPSAGQQDAEPVTDPALLGEPGWGGDR